MNHSRLVQQSMTSSGCKTYTAFAQEVGVTRQAIMIWLKNNYVPEKSRGLVADASNGVVEARFFTPLWEK
jgi:hypothetical protein